MTTPSEDYRLIPLSQGQFAIVDAADFEWLSQWKWSALWSRYSRSFYAVRRSSKTEGRRTTSMHRVIMGLHVGEPISVDHINHNTLDNRRNNLRTATNAQNQRNQRRHRDANNEYRGVSKNHWGWMARIAVDGKRIYLGIRKTPEEARELYQEAAKRLHGEFAGLD